MRWRKSFMCVLVMLALMIPVAPAGAVNEYLCEGVPSSGFTDVSLNPFAPFIDCLVAWEITTGTGPGTFSPSAPVDRWQMAVFLMRLWSITTASLSGTSQGFTDTSGLSSEAQTAINQVAQLSITTGVAPGLYSPTTQVTRWQMALFLARFVYAIGHATPTPEPTGFTDIGALGAETQNAIAIVKTLGITSGTSATTFSPNDVVTREQMSAFLVRTLQATFQIGISVFTDSCSTSGDVETCTGTGTWIANVPLVFGHGWVVELPGDPTSVDSPDTKVDFLLDSVVQIATTTRVQVSGALYRNWFVSLPGGLSGSHTLEARYYGEGDLLFVDVVTVSFD